MTCGPLYYGKIKEETKWRDKAHPYFKLEMCWVCLWTEELVQIWVGLSEYAYLTRKRQSKQLAKSWCALSNSKWENPFIARVLMCALVV